MKGYTAADAERLARGNVSVGVNLDALTGKVGDERTRASVAVPLPPSTNNLFAGKGRRYVSAAYKAWKQAAYPVVKMLSPPESLPCEVWLTVCGKVNRQRDADNFFKAILDSLVACKVLPGDSLMYVHGVHTVYRPDDGEGRVEVGFSEV